MCAVCRALGWRAWVEVWRVAFGFCLLPLFRRLCRTNTDKIARQNLTKKVLEVIKQGNVSPLGMLRTNSAYPQYRMECLQQGANYFFLLKILARLYCWSSSSTSLHFFKQLFRDVQNPIDFFPSDGSFFIVDQVRITCLAFKYFPSISTPRVQTC